jgi:hypothetical protein
MFVIKFFIFPPKRIFVYSIIISAKSLTVIGSPRYFWIPRYVFDQKDGVDYKGHFGIISIKKEKAIIAKKEKAALIVDESFMNVMSQKNERAKQLIILYYDSITLIKFNEK